MLFGQESKASFSIILVLFSAHPATALADRTSCLMDCGTTQSNTVNAARAYERQRKSMADSELTQCLARANNRWLYCNNGYDYGALQVALTTLDPAETLALICSGELLLDEDDCYAVKTEAYQHADNYVSNVTTYADQQFTNCINNTCPAQ